MTNKQLKKFLWQFGVYGAVLTYLGLDLFVFNGPLSKRISAKDPQSAEAIARAKANGVVAQVFNHPITRSQVLRAAHERVWRMGQNYDDMTTSQQQLVRYAALDELIDHELLRVKAMAHTEKLIINSKELESRVERFKRRFSGDKALLTAMKSQGIEGMQDLRDRIAAQMQQEAYIELRIAPLSEVSEEEARNWFEQNKKQLANPEHRHLRHLFIPSLEVQEAAARQQLEAAKAALNSGDSDFATLAKQISRDSATKHNGGDLGWVVRERLPADFAKAVWDLPAYQPTLIESSIGWHLVEVLGQQPAKQRIFEEAREEIIAAIKSIKRREATKKYREALRQFEGHRVTVYHDMMR
ncbi:MAG: peptidylprolyl isomerase [Luteolibacter sp.]